MAVMLTAWLYTESYNLKVAALSLVFITTTTVWLLGVKNPVLSRILSDPSIVTLILRDPGGTYLLK